MNSSRKQGQNSSSTALAGSDEGMVLAARKRSSLSLFEIEQRKQQTERLSFVNTIGTGSYGRVLLAQDRENSNYYAVKLLSIRNIVQYEKVKSMKRKSEFVKREKEILSTISHPFIVPFHWTHHCDQFLYIVLDYVPGGELFSYMKDQGTFDLATATFYIAEIVLAFEYLHSLNIIYRDLKPENVCLDVEGHCKLVDFGFAKKTRDLTYTVCGTPEYFSPEMCTTKGHHKATDWWTLGILFFEMLSGGTPFAQRSAENTVQQAILYGRIHWPTLIDPVAKKFIQKLLNRCPIDRLGSGNAGAGEVKKDPVFKKIQWNELHSRKTLPPIIPKVENSGDTSNFPKYSEDWRLTPFASDTEIDIFIDF